jgi:stress response protein SCP2
VKGKNMTLADHSVQPHSTIRLLVRLYEVPDELDHVIFQLSWGYPSTGIDYLDATVFLYRGVKFADVVDWQHRKSRFGSITHSGDVPDSGGYSCHHKINVSIKSLQNDIDTLVFTLSSWRSPNISKFKNPSLRFFDENFPEQQLCSDEMEHAASSQAIIMCCLSKSKDSHWKVYSLKTLSSGNAKNYKPLQQKIASLIQQGFV